MNKIFIGDGKVCKVLRKKEDLVISHSQIEITNIDSVRSALLDKIDKNSVVVNTAAKISLEYCEFNKIDSYKCNVIGPINILEICASKGCKLVHLGSGCIFDGNQQPSTEDTHPSPACWYSHTKCWADQALMNYGYDNLLILRPRQLISAFPYFTNMLTKFLDLSFKSVLRCIDEENSITCIEDLGLMIDHLLESGQKGIFNCANTGTISPYFIAIALKKIKKDIEVEKISYEEYLKNTNIKRVNTILDLGKIINTGHTPRNCFEALDYCIDNYGKIK